MLTGLKLSEREKILLLAGFLVVLVYLFYNWIYLPNEKTIQERTDQVNTLAREAEALQKYAKDTKSFKNTDLPLSDKLSKLTLAIPVDNDNSLLVDSIQSLAEKNNVTMLQFKPQQAIGMKNYKKVPVSLSLSGNYSALAEYLKSLEESPRVMTFQDLKLASSGTGQGYTMELNIVAYSR